MNVYMFIRWQFTRSQFISIRVFCVFLANIGAATHAAAVVIHITACRLCVVIMRQIQTHTRKSAHDMAEAHCVRFNLSPVYSVMCTDDVCTDTVQNVCGFACTHPQQYAAMLCCCFHQQPLSLNDDTIYTQKTHRQCGVGLCSARERRLCRNMCCAPEEEKTKNGECVMLDVFCMPHVRPRHIAHMPHMVFERLHHESQD